MQSNSNIIIYTNFLGKIFINFFFCLNVSGLGLLLINYYSLIASKLCIFLQSFAYKLPVGWINMQRQQRKHCGCKKFLWARQLFLVIFLH